MLLGAGFTITFPTYRTPQVSLGAREDPPSPTNMSFKEHDQGLTPSLIEAREREVLDEIDKLIDKKLYFALAQVNPGDPNAATIVDDPEIREQTKNLKTAVAALIERHESIISTIARSKKDQGNDKPV
ncbi:hypothetical protein SLS53_004620 [Cytospora paraplurivora]|uniref:Uncharacterized protein n=1 Tax=Cytospora paraplurivora TaxID=2898453 RepID=A0AAN9UA74_9PEZI